MADKGVDTREVLGTSVTIKWQKSNFGEWLGYTYLPGPDGLHNQGAGFEARGKSPDEACQAVADKVAQWLQKRQ